MAIVIIGGTTEPAVIGWSAIAMTVGGLCGGVAAWIGTAIPDRWLAPVAAFGTVLSLGATLALTIAGIPALCSPPRRPVR